MTFAELGFDSSVIDVGPAMPVAGDPAREYVAGLGSTPVLAPLDLDGLRGRGFLRRHSLATYRAMTLIPAVGSSLRAIKTAALSGGLKLSPAIPADSDGDGQPDPNADLAESILQECRASVAYLQYTTPAQAILWEAMDGLAEGHKLAEVVLAPDPLAPAGVRRYRLDRVKFKPRWSYRFVVDPALNILAVRVWDATAGSDGQGDWVDLDPRKFARWSWDVRDGDPRGHSVLDEPYMACAMLVELWPYAQKGWKSFAVPMIWGTVGPNAQNIPETDANGHAIPGKTVPPHVAMNRAQQALEGGSIATGAHGSDLKVVESARDGVMMVEAIGLLKGEIIHSILLQLRATTEAEHGSKADSQTGENILQTLVQVVRDWACGPFRSVLRTLVEANHGPAVADRLTPLVSLGVVGAKDLLTFAQAIGLLFSSGYFAESQLPAMDDLMNFPPRRPGAPRVGPRIDGGGDGGDGTTSSGDQSPPETTDRKPLTIAEFHRMRTWINAQIAKFEAQVQAEGGAV